MRLSRIGLLAALLALALASLLLVRCDAAGGDISPASDPSGPTTGCTSQASDTCPYDQPLFVTCAPGVVFDAGDLACAPAYPSGGGSGFCCGACALTPDASVCDGGGYLACISPYQYNTSACASLVVNDGGASNRLTWCCP